jgi:peptide/nickel transport system permease protein
MSGYLTRRFFHSIIIIIGISIAVFVISRFTGDPVSIMVGPDTSQADRVVIRKELGLDQPIPVQYLFFLKGALQGNFGKSIRYEESAFRLVLQRIPATSRLIFFTLLWALVFSIPIGILSAIKRNSFFDLVGMTFTFLGQSIPSFWLGIMLILFLAVRLHLLPASGFVPFFQDPLANLQRMLMPSFVLGASLAAALMRQTRNSMIEVMSANYIRTAYSKGLAERIVIFRHALRNGLIPIVTILGLQMGALMGGAVVTEQIFVVPGFGRLIVESVFTRDYPLVQGVVLITASSYVLINLLVDVSYSLLNPRIRVKGSAGES